MPWAPQIGCRGPEILPWNVSAAPQSQSYRQDEGFLCSSLTSQRCTSVSSTNHSVPIPVQSFRAILQNHGRSGDRKWRTTATGKVWFPSQSMPRMVTFCLKDQRSTSKSMFAAFGSLDHRGDFKARKTGLVWVECLQNTKRSGNVEMCP